uniref:Uncharacterized protein n=1 Tax=Glossina austeni TaxID=7395 RepID=A0A1A9VHF4_GLOAU
MIKNAFNCFKPLNLCYREHIALPAGQGSGNSTDSQGKEIYEFDVLFPTVFPSVRLCSQTAMVTAIAIASYSMWYYFYKFQALITERATLMFDLASALVCGSKWIAEPALKIAGSNGAWIISTNNIIGNDNSDFRQPVSE